MTSSDGTLFEMAADSPATLSLADEYGVPPFTLLDTRQGYWQARRDRWLALGIKPETGRDTHMIYRGPTSSDPFLYEKKSRYEAEIGRTVTPSEFIASGAYDADAAAYASGGSLFDPVVCELAYRWFCPAQGVVLDPFAGGAVRGLVAAILGYSYVGIELRPEQVAANREQATSVLTPTTLARQGVVAPPRWVQGDSDAILAAATELPRADLIFTCPPYADLEVYSDDPADLSNMDYDAFRIAYSRILQRAAERLLPDRFACVVIGNVRDRQGHLRDLVGLTVRAMEQAGLHYYNEAIILNQTGSGAIRARKTFGSSRKLVRLHQSVLVFVKGSPKAATAAIVGMTESAEAERDVAA